MFIQHLSSRAVGGFSGIKLLMSFFATESYFVQGCEDAESSETRFRLCQELWDKIKIDTEVRTDVQQEDQTVDCRKYVLIVD